MTVNKRNIEQYIENSWLNLGRYFDYENIKSCFPPVTEEDKENPYESFIKTILEPKNFYFTVKHIFGIELLPFQLCILEELWHKKYPMLIASRGAGKSFILGLYAVLRALLHQGCKIIIVGAAFRQAKVVFEYSYKIWDNSPILKDICAATKSGPRHDADMLSLTIGESTIIAIPLGDGSKIRGQRANYIIADEFACLDKNTLIETNEGLLRIGDCQDKTKIACVNKNGNLEKPKFFIKTPLTDVYEIKTFGGYSFKCSDKHKVMTKQGWKLAKDLTSDDFLVFDNKYKFPEKELVNEELAYLFGLLLSRGCLKHKSRIQVRNTDINLINDVISIFSKISNKSYSLNTKDRSLDNRGRTLICKKYYNFLIYDQELRNKFNDLGLGYEDVLEKKIPQSILSSSRKIVLKFISGLFNGGGSCTYETVKNRIVLSYYTASKQLAQEVQIVLKKMGYFSTLQTRKSKISKKSFYAVRLNGKRAYYLAKELNIEKFNNILNLCFKKDVVNDNNDTVIFTERYSGYLEASSFYDKNKSFPYVKVKSVVKLDYQDNLYDFYLPETNSFYGNGFIQHNSIPESIYENVVAGFAAVNSSPISQVKKQAKIQALKKEGLWNKEDQDLLDRSNMGNQAILSGTAYYDFNHFSKYHKLYKKFILSQDDPKKLEEVFPDGIPETFKSKDYVIIRLPVQVLPKGFMDDKHVARSKAAVHSGIYQMEFGACFTTDSNGFFKRSLIESCVTTNPILDINGDSIQFSAVIKGNAKGSYVYGVDPASENDNFSIVIIELHETHRRIVYCWTTNKKKHAELISKNLIQENDYYGYCARKIRNLMKVFPVERIAIDSQGGGVAVEEALHDKDKIKPGEQPIWRVVDPKNPYYTDDLHGLHILEMINFAKAEWTSAANHGLRKDFEDKTLLFPYFDTLSLEFAANEDSVNNRTYDTLEDCFMEIEELKDELASIVHTQTTATGRDRWDTPETKLPGGKKGRLRKDRYSALLMANMVARTLQRQQEEKPYQSVGGFSHDIAGTGSSKNLYIAPAWFNLEKNCKNYGRMVKRTGNLN